MDTVNVSRTLDTGMELDFPAYWPFILCKAGCRDFNTVALSAMEENRKKTERENGSSLRDENE